MTGAECGARVVTRAGEARGWVVGGTDGRVVVGVADKRAAGGRVETQRDPRGLEACLGGVEEVPA